MKRFIACVICMLFLFAGCTGGGNTEKTTTDPINTTLEARIDVPLRINEDALNDSDTGSLIEMLQIVGADSAEIKRLNSEMKSWYDELEKTYVGNLDYWCVAQAWPTETDRYLNAFVTYCDYPTYGTYGKVRSWVFDKQTGKEITLEDALKMAGTDEKKLLADFSRWCAEEDQRIEQKIDSIAFRMLPSGKPQFVVGLGLLYNEDDDAWVNFYTWVDGEIVFWESIPFNVDDVTGEYTGGLLFCQETLSQRPEYDPAPTQEEAFDIIGGIAEYQDYLEQGMLVKVDDTEAAVNGEMCIFIEVGTNREGQFVREAFYAVSYTNVYRLNPFTGEFNPVAFG